MVEHFSHHFSRGFEAVYCDGFLFAFHAISACRIEILPRNGRGATHRLGVCALLSRMVLPTKR